MTPLLFVHSSAVEHTALCGTAPCQHTAPLQFEMQRDDGIQGTQTSNDRNGERVLPRQRATIGRSRRHQCFTERGSERKQDQRYHPTHTKDMECEEIGHPHTTPQKLRFCHAQWPPKLVDEACLGIP